ncbi:DUF1450 domain-containing protein [Halalkalibacter nanhaiisediminis]|uniref:DUF1450 domain-containing protein n=1 Tax=Halalkalibacter nanhaiisediminis TaxID=688079 RepID=UPI00119D6B73|nr:DUF1450 domain-containing protein [Halalkalibacter nanhaiisediminis]
MKKIYFCGDNKFKTKKIYKNLKASYPELDIKQKGCLGKCKTCKQCPITLIDGELIKSKTGKKHYHKLNKKIFKESV